MRKSLLLLIVTIGIFLSACAPSAQETALPIPTPTEAPLHCSPDNKPLITQQLAFKDILVGTTLKEDVIASEGLPEDVQKFEYFTEFWYYELNSPAFYSLEFKGKRILSVRVRAGLTLVDIYEMFGCPDVLLLSPGPPVAQFEDEWIHLFYVRAGVFFTYPGGRLDDDVVLHDQYFYLPEDIEKKIADLEDFGYTRIDWEVHSPKR